MPPARKLTPIEVLDREHHCRSGPMISTIYVKVADHESAYSVVGAQ
jgi:hypothetical protein